MNRYDEWTRYLGWWVANALEREGYELNRAKSARDPEPATPPSTWARIRSLLP